MKKLIAISVYGNSPMYWCGAERNARLVSEIYPGWTLRLYIDNLKYAKCYEDLGCEVVHMKRSRGQSGMFWRFLSAWDEEAARVIFRDADSRLNVREAAAVRAWEESGLDAHCMHDHKHHRILPISGGMWGIKCRVLSKELYRMVQRRGIKPQKRVADMRFLANCVYPVIENTLLRHTSVSSLKGWKGVPFPPHPPYKGFVGEQFDENDKSFSVR